MKRSSRCWLSILSCCNDPSSNAATAQCSAGPSRTSARCFEAGKEVSRKGAKEDAKRLSFNFFAFFFAALRLCVRFAVEPAKITRTVETIPSVLCCRQSHKLAIDFYGDKLSGQRNSLRLPALRASGAQVVGQVPGVRRVEFVR